MANNRIVRYVTNTALLAVLAAAGIGVYQLGTSGTDVEIQEEAPSYLNDTADNKENEDSAVDAGTSLVEAEMKDERTDTEKEMSGVENTVLADNDDADQTSVQTVDGNGAAQSAVNTESVSTSASAEAAPKLSFSEDTLMEWPVDGSILLDYNMDQTVYFPTLDQYKLSPAISVQAVDGAPVLASVPGTVYSIEEDPQTGTTVTMEIGSGYQAVYGQLKDLTVEEGDTVTKGTVIGYVGTPTKYYSKEGSNLYFAMKKNGEPVDPIAYLP